MKIKHNENRKVNAFTLIEMIGVLAVIAILAALLIPKIFEAINNARINNAVVSYNTVKTAVMDHYAKFGSLTSSNGVTLTLPEQAYDKVLLTEAFLDKPFIVKIGDGINSPTNTHVEAITGVSAATAVTAANAGYDLDGSGATVNDVAAPTGVILQTVITGVTEADARDVSLRLDGEALSSAVGADDLKGRVKYASATPTTVYIYITHR